MPSGWPPGTAVLPSGAGTTCPREIGPALNLHPPLVRLLQPKINKILKTLEERLLVKSVKSVQNTSKKVGLLVALVQSPGSID